MSWEAGIGGNETLATKVNSGKSMFPYDGLRCNNDFKKQRKPILLYNISVSIVVNQSFQGLLPAKTKKDGIIQ